MFEIYKILQTKTSLEKQLHSLFFCSFCLNAEHWNKRLLTLQLEDKEPHQNIKFILIFTTIFEQYSQLKNCEFQCQHLYGTFFTLIFCSGAICYKYALYSVPIQHQNLKTNAVTASSNGAIFDEFYYQQQHKCIKSTIFNAQ